MGEVGAGWGKLVADKRDRTNWLRGEAERDGVKLVAAEAKRD